MTDHANAPSTAPSPGDRRFDAFRRLSVTQEGPVLRVWLDRADKRNAHDQTMVEEIGDLFLGLEKAFDVRVVVLGGRGPTFCAGADRRERLPEAATARERRWRAQVGRRAVRAIEECDAVTIARVHGHAVGGGSCLATACDFRITTESCLWWLPEVELGTPLPWGGTPRLIQELGMARARQYVMTGERVPGPTAAAWGLAHECVPDDRLDEAVDRWVARLLAMPAFAVQATKAQLRGYQRLAALGDLSEADGDLSTLARQTDDYRRGFQGF
jgi:enoyl-CoA hydratase/carnithine racemase